MRASWLWCGMLLFAVPDRVALAALPAQESEDPEVEAALKTVKDRRLAWSDKLEAMDEVLGGSDEAIGEMASVLAKRLATLEAAQEKDWERLARDFEKAAGKLPKARIGKKEQARIDTLRKTWLAASRDKNLSKTQVSEVCDPAHAELAQLLDVDVTQVWDAEPKLEKRWTAFVDELDDRILIYEYWVAACERLRIAGDGWERKSFVRAELADPESAEEAWLAALDELAQLATLMPDRDRKTMIANAQDFAQLTPEEARGVRILNRIRVRAGLSALRIDLKLCDASRGHSQDMVEHGFFAHESPVPGKKSPSDRAAKAGTSGGAENIAAGQRSGRGAIDAWWYSPGHHRNMMGGHARIGLGRHQNHWTQMFG